jgi:hypothetical protein
MHVDAARVHAAEPDGAERGAAHLLASEPSRDPSSVGMLRAAAADALGRGAPNSAVTYLERARREGPASNVTAALLRELGVADSLSGEPVAIERLREALEMAQDPHERAVIAQDLANVLIFADSGQVAVGVIEAAIEDLGDADSAVTQALEAQLLGAAAQQLSTRPAHRAHLARVGARELGDSPTERMLLADLALWSCLAGERASVVRALAERAVGGGRLLAEVGSGRLTFHCVPNALMFSDSLEPARYWMDRGIADAGARGSLVGYAEGSCFRADAAYRVGDLAAAEADRAPQSKPEALTVGRWRLTSCASSRRC